MGKNQDRVPPDKNEKLRQDSNHQDSNQQSNESGRQVSSTQGIGSTFKNKSASLNPSWDEQPSEYKSDDERKDFDNPHDPYHELEMGKQTATDSDLDFRESTIRENSTEHQRKDH